MPDVIQERKINGHVVTERAGHSENLVYVDGNLVNTNWIDTITLLEDGQIPAQEDPVTAMHRVLGACGIRY